MFTHDRFIFDGVDSMGLNVGLIWNSSGFQTQSVVKKTLNKDKNTLHSVDLAKQTFTIKVALFNDTFTEIMPMTVEKRREIIQWLCKDYFCAFQPYDNQHLFYYLIFTEVTRSYLNTDERGYIELKAECDSAYVATHFDVFKLDIDNEADIEIPNKGDIVTKPILEIAMRDKNSVRIRNRSNGKTLEIKDTLENETITIDCHDMYVKSNMTGNKYSKFNRVFIEFVTGMNLLEIEGNCRLKIKYQHYFLM